VTVERPSSSIVEYGAWPSPLSAARLVEAPGKVGTCLAAGDDVWWDEARPSEGGRVQLVRLAADASRFDVLPDGWGARTRAHEYGGGAWVLAGGGVVFARWEDQRLYAGRSGEGPVPLTPEPSVPHGLRYADPRPSPDGRWLVCIRESHEPEAMAAHGEAVNEVVAVPLDGSAASDPSAIRILASGADFFHAPRISPDGSTLAWIEWHHPNMPWDGAELWRAPFDPLAGEVHAAGKAELVSGGPAEVTQAPEFGADGTLWFLSERSGWSNLHRLMPGAAAGAIERVGAVDAELGGPGWIFGCRWFTVLADGRVVALLVRDGFGSLALIDGAPGQAPVVLETPITDPAAVVAHADDGSVLVVGGTATAGPSPYRFRLAGSRVVGWEALAPSPEHVIEPAWIAPPEPIDFPSTGGRISHALLYRPTNPTVVPPEGAKPPLLVVIHGGPTSAARPILNLAVQYWTSRGFLVADVNYGGSTGFGPEYRRSLNGQWGVIDIEDCVAVARHLVDAGEVDAAHLAIRGGSAGGYTALAAHAFHDVFTAGASHFGVADLAALAADTHKFESRYLDTLIGPWPEARDVYDARSPIHHTDGFHQPMAVFQGLEDEVVPPAQSEMIVAALADRGVPHVYLAFEGEQHGFRQAPNIIRSLEVELWFYGRVFGFTPADPIEPPHAFGI
jgi:dipeptidyl aminopeptidase/acylaminoacyl peptidase